VSTYALVVGGRAAWTGPSRPSLVQAALNLWVDGVETARMVGALDAKIDKQNAWLDANEGHPLWRERLNTRLARWEERRRWVERMDTVAIDAANLLAKLSAGERREVDALIGERATGEAIKRWQAGARWKGLGLFDLLNEQLRLEYPGNDEPPF